MLRSAEIISDAYNIVLVKGLELVEYFEHKVTNILIRYYDDLKFCLVNIFYFLLFSFENLEARSRIVAAK